MNRWNRPISIFDAGTDRCCQHDRPAAHGLLGLVSVIAPAIVGGNTVIVLSSEAHPLTAITFSEVLHTSDLPGGVVNILTGQVAELVGHFPITWT